MEISIQLIINSLLLGVGLAMDAFSVSLANGLHEPCMHKAKILSIAGTFAFFQALMPIIGWFCVHTIADKFESFKPFIPWIALILLSYIGIGMLREGISKKETIQSSCNKLTFGMLFVQGIATSIDALSVGFTIAEYSVFQAILSAFVIAVVTFLISFAGVILGKKFGTRFAGKSSILGGVILIFIGIEVFIKNVF